MDDKKGTIATELEGAADVTCYAFYRRPVRQVDGVTIYAPSVGPRHEKPRVHWIYRRGGYNPDDGSYGRCWTYGEAKNIIAKHNDQNQGPRTKNL